MFVVCHKDDDQFNSLHVYRGRHSILTVLVRNDVVFALSPKGDVFIVSHRALPEDKNSDCIRIFQLDGKRNERWIRTWSFSITALAVFPDSSHFVFGTGEGEVGIANREGLVQGTTLAHNSSEKQKITSIAVSNSFIVLLCEEGIDILTKELEPVVCLGVCRPLCVGISPNEQWIACGGVARIMVYSIADELWYLKDLKQVKADIVAIAVSNDSVICGSSDGHLFLKSTVDSGIATSEMLLLTHRSQIPVRAIVSSHNVIFSGWADETIQRRNMSGLPQSVTPKDEEMDKASVQDRLIFGTNSKEPVTDEQRQVVLGVLFQGVKIPSYNFDEIVRLYVACARKSRESGYPDWTLEQRRFLGSLAEQCVMVAKKEHAGAIHLLVQSIETQLCLLYIII
jgi:hypothetical protein